MNQKELQLATPEEIIVFLIASGETIRMQQLPTDPDFDACDYYQYEWDERNNSFKVRYLGASFEQSGPWDDGDDDYYDEYGDIIDYDTCWYTPEETVSKIFENIEENYTPALQTYWGND